jgi:hypothetical protein
MRQSLLLALVLLSDLRLAAAEPPATFTVSVDLPFVSRYVFRGLEISRNRFQPSVTVTSGNLNGGVWANQPFARTGDTEVDFFANYDVPLNKDWKTTLGATAYHYPRADPSAGEHRTTLEPKLAVTGPLGPLASTLAIFHDTKLRTTALEGGLTSTMSLGEATIDLGGIGGQVFPDSSDAYAYWGLTAKLSFKVSGSVTTYVGANYASHNLAGIGKNLLFGTTGLTFAF